MKKNIFLIFMFFLFQICYSEVMHTRELIIDIYNPINSDRVFEAKAVSVVWDSDYYITSAFDTAWSTSTGIGRAGFDLLDGNTGPNSILGFGLYQIKCSAHNTSFYIDYRDYYWDGCPDVYIEYNWTNREFIYNSGAINDDTLKIWEMLGQNQEIDKFQPTTPTNLALSYSNGNPVLNWDLSEPESAAYYKIYREISSSPGWNCIDSTGAGISTYTDNSFSIGNAYARYCIVAVSGNGKINSPDSSNQVQTSVKPTTPSNLTVTWSNNRPLLTWRCSEPRAAATYEVWRKVKGGFKYLQTIEDWCCIHYGQAGDTTYSDNGFSSGSGYVAYYKIRAVSGDGNLYSPDWSNTVSVTGNFTPNAKDKKFRAVEIDPIPTEFCLHPVYPNPFNITTTLKLDLPEETRFSLGIYDIKGCEVWRLNNRQTNTYPAGYHSIVWDGRDNSGAVVPTGVYFIVYHSAEHRLSQKVVLMKQIFKSPDRS